MADGRDILAKDYYRLRLFLVLINWFYRIRDVVGDNGTRRSRRCRFMNLSALNVVTQQKS